MNYALILAFDERNYSLNSFPNCFSPLLGKSMITYLIDELKRIDIQPICIASSLEEVSLFNSEYAYEKNQFFLSIENIIKEDGVTLFIPSYKPLVDHTIIRETIDYHSFNGNEVTIVSTEEKIKNKQANKDKSKIHKCKSLDDSIYLINNKVLKKIFSQKENLKFPFNLENLIKRIKGKIGFMSIRKTYKFANIVNAYQLSKIEDILRNEINRNHMVNGVYIENSKTISIGPDVCLEPKSIIRSGSIILGNSLIKSNAVIGPNSEISNSYIGENAIVAHSVVVDSSVGKGAMVGPFTHLRMHTSVGDYDRIGNFVEIKNSTIGEKTNISHLTYVGDTECGKGVNFGCGVVTVNYNGVSKFKTTIGNNVFIGCNSNLIAPIKIKNGAFIAAGSTITEDLEEYDFSIARMKQITKSGYAKKYGYKKFFEEDESLSS